jgi:5-formyltetrahydrofolate cyclo-ligase
VAVPRLCAARCFWELDPRRLRDAARVATIAGASAAGRPVDPRRMPHLDLVVIGSVAVNRRGERVGKGGGYADLEYAILRELAIPGTRACDRGAESWRVDTRWSVDATRAPM